MSVNLPISVGEALDKLTILDIKLKKIQDENRLKYVREEYEELKQLIGSFYETNKFFYNLLLKINETIWDVQDDLRLNKVPSSNDLYKIILDENDRRCRVKNKINSKSLSNMREQKGYPLKKAFICSHLGIGDMICMIGIVRYLSTIFDKVYVMCKEKYLENIKLFYRDDDNITFITCGNDEILKFDNLSEYQGMKTFICGYHSNQNNDFIFKDNIPEKFYEQMGFDINIAKEYFFIDDLEYDENIKEIINQEYIFVHDISSSHELDISKKLLEKDKNLLIINPSQNPYTKDHKYYDILEKIQNKPIIYFIPLIKNAKKIYTIDSSFFNLINFIDTKADEHFCISRGNRVYKLFTKFKYVNISNI